MSQSKQIKDEDRLIFLDVEMTANIPGSNNVRYILEIAVCEVCAKSFNYGKKMSWLVKPPSLDLITKKFLPEKENFREAKTFREISTELKQWLHGKTVMGYNLDGADVPLIEESYKRESMDPPEMEKTIDVYRMVQGCFDKKIRRIPSLSLEDLGKYFGLITTQSHRALEDVFLTVEVLKCISWSLIIEAGGDESLKKAQYARPDPNTSTSKKRPRKLASSIQSSASSIPPSASSIPSSASSISSTSSMDDDGDLLVLKLIRKLCRMQSSPTDLEYVVLGQSPMYVVTNEEEARCLLNCLTTGAVWSNPPGIKLDWGNPIFVINRPEHKQKLVDILKPSLANKVHFLPGC